jgi:hypothetical protein
LRKTLFVVPSQGLKNWFAPLLGHSQCHICQGSQAEVTISPF